MAMVDLAVIQELPGYKVILKAILRSQIQQLVEQLAVSTDEESVILTVSTSDGTLNHLGTDMGKSFIQHHEDITSQFLAFCLKSQHKKRLKNQEKNDTKSFEMGSLSNPTRYEQESQYLARGLGQNPRTQSSGYTTRISPKSRYTGIRHGPYLSSHSQRKRSKLNTSTSVRSESNANLKQTMVAVSEAGYRGDSDNADFTENIGDENVSDCRKEDIISKQSTVQETSAKLTETVSAHSVNFIDDKSDKSSESLVSTVQQETALDSVAALSNTTSSFESLSGSDSNLKLDIKVGDTNEDENDLEIIKIEPDASVEQILYSEIGATEVQDDLTNQGYREELKMNSEGDVSGLGHQVANTHSINESYVENVIICSVEGCGKIFRERRNMARHIRTHTNEKPYGCVYCEFRTARKDSLKRHETKHLIYSNMNLFWNTKQTHLDK